MNAPQKFTATLNCHDLRKIVAGLSLEQLLEGVHSPGYDDRLGHYSYTHSGRIFFPCDPLPSEIFIEDIATGLSRAFRFNGQTINGISVAEHSLLVEEQVENPDEKLEALMHDAPESLIGDLIRPMKTLPFYGDIYLKVEDRLAKTIAERFKLTYPWPASVKRADEILCHADIIQNIGSKEDGVHFDRAVYDRNTEKPPTINFEYWTPEVAKQKFLARFYELAKARGLEV